MYKVVQSDLGSEKKSGS